MTKRRKKYHEEHQNHERWLVSYADFITLLFAFFVVMYAISNVNEGKYRVLSSTLNTVFGANKQQSGVILPEVKNPEFQPIDLIAKLPKPRIMNDAQIKEKQKEKMNSMEKNMLKALEPLVKEGKVNIRQTAKGLVVDINASLLFASGEAKLNEDAQAVLQAVAEVLAPEAYELEVEGYTDNAPIKSAIFPSNWELSAVRASSVARLLMERGIQESRITAIGQGPKNPVGDNATQEGRAKNRRVSITVMSLFK